MSGGVGLYVVETDDGNGYTMVRRFVIVAPSAEEAASIAARHTWPAATDEQRASMDDRVTVGRIGDYDPGSMGGRIMAAAGGVIG